MTDPTGPVFVVGAPRSGTSLLYKALCLHPDAAWISNWIRRFPHAPQLARLNRIAGAMPQRRRRVWFGAGGDNAYAYARRRPWHERLVPMPVEGQPLFAACGLDGGLSQGSRPPARSLHELMAAVTAHGGGPVAVSKCISNNRSIPVLAAAFPTARFVHVVRDGRAVAHSLSRVDWWPDATVWWLGQTPREWAIAGGDPWELCGRHWTQEVTATRSGLDTVGPDRVIDLRYEQLVAAPREELARAAAAVGLSPTEGWRNEIARLRYPNNDEQWRASLDPGAIETLERIQEPLLTELGYRP